MNRLSKKQIKRETKLADTSAQTSLSKQSNKRRLATNQTSCSLVPPIVHEVLHSPGQPLDVGTRAFNEPRFGHDFSQVRVHTDARAAESARAVNAQAYTVGPDIAFRSGRYAPRTGEGQRLVAHELAHVVQQENGGEVVPTMLS